MCKHECMAGFCQYMNMRAKVYERHIYIPEAKLGAHAWIAIIFYSVYIMMSYCTKATHTMQHTAADLLQIGSNRSVALTVHKHDGCIG